MNADDLVHITADVRRLAERVEGLEDLREQVQELADQMLADLQADRAKAASGAVSTWVDLDFEQAEAALGELWDWMRLVLIHHPQATGALRPCWYRHPAAVQVLLDTRSAWLLAYRESGHGTPVLSALDFSQRHLPHLERFLARELGTCTSVRHDPDRTAPPPATEPDVTAYLRWWAADRDPATEPSAPAAP